MRTRFYYPLWEIQTKVKADYEAKVHDVPFETGGFYAFLNNLVATGGTDTTYTTTLFQHYIRPSNYRQDYIYIDILHGPWYEVDAPRYWDADNHIYMDAIKEWVGKVYVWLQESQVRYEKLLALYTAEANNLMADLESYQVTKFNDTPQNNAVGYDDTHTTTATKTLSSSQVATKIARLNEVRALWHNLYSDWAAEFGRIFALAS